MESSLKIVWKTKKAILLSETLLYFLEPKYNLLSETYYFKIPKNLITSTFFAEKDTLKYRYASAKASNAAQMINCAMFLCKYLKVANQTMLFDSPRHGF